MCISILSGHISDKMHVTVVLPQPREHLRMSCIFKGKP